MTTETLLPPVHPGEILLKDFIEPNNLCMRQVGRDLGVPACRISEICNSRRGITADTALRLARYFGTSAELWTGLQSTYELRRAQRKSGQEILEQVTPYGNQ